MSIVQIKQKFYCIILYFNCYSAQNELYNIQMRIFQRIMKNSIQ